MKLELITTILTISLLIVSMSEFMRTRKLRKLAYPLITIYFLIGIPILRKFINNEVLFICFAILSFAITMIFLYNELKLSNKEKNLPH